MINEEGKQMKFKEYTAKMEKYYYRVEKEMEKKSDYPVSSNHLIAFCHRDF